MYNLIFFYYGLAAMLAELVLFRELSVLFYANELFLGAFLSSWLFWGVQLQRPVDTETARAYLAAKTYPVSGKKLINQER